MAKTKTYTHEQTKDVIVSHRHPKRTTYTKETDYGTHMEINRTTFPITTEDEDTHIIVPNKHKHIIAQTLYFQFARYDDQHKIVIIPIKNHVEVMDTQEFKLLIKKLILGWYAEAGFRAPKICQWTIGNTNGRSWKKHGKSTHDNEWL